MRLVQLIESDPFVHKRGRNRRHEGCRVTLPEPADHLVAGFQRVLRPIQRGEGSRSVHEGARDRLPEGRDVAVPEPTDDPVAGLQGVLRPIQRAQGGPLVHQSLGDPLQNGGTLTLSGASDYVLVGGHGVCGTAPNTQSVLEELPRRSLCRFERASLRRPHAIVIRLNASHRGCCHFHGCRVPTENCYETGGHLLQQLSAVLGQAR